MLLEIMLKLFQVHTSIAGTQQVSTSGNFALDFASLEKLAIKKYIEAMSKVCDGLRGDASVAAQEIGFDNPCEIVDGRPRDARNGLPFD